MQAREAGTQAGRGSVPCPGEMGTAGGANRLGVPGTELADLPRERESL